MKRKGFTDKKILKTEQDGQSDCAKLLRSGEEMSELIAKTVSKSLLYFSLEILSHRLSKSTQKGMLCTDFSVRRSASRVDFSRGARRNRRKTRITTKTPKT